MKREIEIKRMDELSQKCYQNGSAEGERLKQKYIYYRTRRNFSMSYNSSSSNNSYPYLSTSKSFQCLEQSIRERKTSQYSSKNRAFESDKADHDNNNFLRSTMGSFSSRPNKDLLESAAIQSERKKQLNLRHTTGNLADILKNLKFDKQPQQQQPVISKKYADLTLTQHSPSITTNVPPSNGFKKQKTNYSTLYESRPATNYEYSETKKDKSSKMDIDEILNKLKREKQLQSELRKLKEQKKLRQQKELKEKASKGTSSLSNLLSTQNPSASYTSTYKAKQVYNKNPEDAINGQRKNNETYTVTTSYKSSQYDKYDFKKAKKDHTTYTPKRDYDFDKKYQDITKKYDTTAKKQYDWKKYTTQSSPNFLKGIKKNTLEVDKPTLNYPKSPTVKSPTVSKPKQDTFSKYFSSSGAQKGQKFDCKVTINDFRLGKALGQGKFGTVYQAIHKQTNSLYALKKVPKSIIKSHYMIDQFILELKLQTFMLNQHILALHGFFHDTQSIYLILDYMEEGTLYSVLKKNKKLQYDDAARKIKEIAKGIIYMHQNGIAHRDIKPENVVMSNGSCKLCDFGWSTICDQRRKTYCGTFDYAAPQILEGTEYDMSVDLWCLGVLAYELLVGKAPFYHIKKEQTKKKILNVESEPIVFPNDLPKDAVDFIDKLLKKDPEERIKNEELLQHPFLAKV